MIVTVDDFGFHHQANELVTQAIDRKFVTHVATMTGLSGKDEALDYIAARREQVSRDSVTFGLHLNVTEGAPVLPVEKVRSIVDSNGKLLGWQPFLKRFVFGKIDRDELQNEVDHQLAALKSSDPGLSFLNSHHHIHAWPGVMRAIAPVMKRHGIQSVRQPSKLWWPAFTHRYGMKGVIIELLSLSRKCEFERFTNEFVDFDWVNPSKTARAAALKLVPNHAELSCHPHVFTTPADAAANPDPSCTLAWLLDHESDVRKQLAKA